MNDEESMSPMERRESKAFQKRQVELMTAVVMWAVLIALLVLAGRGIYVLLW